QVHQPLPRPRELLAREEIALGHGDLSPEDLLLAPAIAGDIDPVDEDLRALADVERDIDLAVRIVLHDLGDGVGRCPPDGTVQVGDVLGAVGQLAPGDPTAGRALDAPLDLPDGQAGRPCHVAPADLELRPFHDDDADDRLRV